MQKGLKVTYWGLGGAATLIAKCSYLLFLLRCIPHTAVGDQHSKTNATGHCCQLSRAAIIARNKHASSGTNNWSSARAEWIGESGSRCSSLCCFLNFAFQRALFRWLILPLALCQRNPIIARNRPASSPLALLSDRPVELSESVNLPTGTRQWWWWWWWWWWWERPLQLQTVLTFFFS